MSYRTACVTGGAGFIGAHLVRELQRRGMAVTVIDDLSVGRRENLPEGIAFVHGSVLDPDVAARATESEVLFHLAARVAIRASFDGIFEDVNTNVLGTASLLRAIAAAPDRQVRRMVFASSMAVYADASAARPISECHSVEPVSPYGVSKLAAEQLVRQACAQAGVDACVLRLFNTFGPGQRYSPYVGVVTIFTRKMSAGERPTIFGNGLQCRDFVHVDDVVQGFVRAMDSAAPGSVFNIGTGVGTTVCELHDRIASMLGFREAPVFLPAVPGELRYSIADIGRATREIGYRPLRTLADTLAGVVREVAGQADVAQAAGGHRGS